MSLDAGDSPVDSGSLYVMSVGNSALLWKVVLPPELSWLPGPATTWSPDARQIAVIDSYGQVEIHDALSGAASGTASTPADAPAWSSRAVPGVSRRDSLYLQAGSATSPDGSMEANAVADANSNIVLRIRRATDGKLLNVAGQAPFAWSPDSRFIAASAFFEIVLVDAANGTTRTLAEASGAARSFNFGGLAWSPDGTRLAFTARQDPGVD